jgi:hypothetical protein
MSTKYNINYNNSDIKLNLWENALWFTLFSISFAFSPKKNAQRHIEFINNLAFVLPCKQYRKLFQYTITHIPLTIAIVENQNSFTKWVYTIMKLIHTTLHIEFIYDYKQLKRYYLDGPGLNTDHWGCFLWRLMHSISFGYVEELKQYYFLFFKQLKYVIICIYCKNSYARFIKYDPEVLLTACTVKNKYNLTKWVYDLHNKVNTKLNKHVNLTFDQVCIFYEQ